jgi:hypothetical protein
MCFQVYFKPSHRLKGKRSLRRRQRLPLHSIKLLFLCRRSAPLSIFGIIVTHILFAKRGESSYKRAYISLKYPFLAIHAKGGESISPKQKDRTTTNFQKFELRKVFQMVIFHDEFSIGILFLIEFQIGTSSSKLITKTLLNTKRRILLRGSFV